MRALLCVLAAGLALTGCLPAPADNHPRPQHDGTLSEALPDLAAEPTLSTLELTEYDLSTDPRGTSAGVSTGEHAEAFGERTFTTANGFLVHITRYRYADDETAFLKFVDDSRAEKWRRGRSTRLSPTVTIDAPPGLSAQRVELVCHAPHKNRSGVEICGELASWARYGETLVGAVITGGSPRGLVNGTAHLQAISVALDSATR